MKKFKKALTLDLMVEFRVPGGWVHQRKQYTVYEGSNVRLEVTSVKADSPEGMTGPDQYPTPVYFGPCPFLDALTKPAKKKSKKKKKS